MIEHSDYAPLSETVTGALLLCRMSEFLDESIQTNIYSSDKDTTVELFVNVIEAAVDRGVQHKRYVTNCPTTIEIGDYGNVAMWEYVLITYMQSLEMHAHNFDFNDSTQLVTIDDLSLVELIESTYDEINNDFESDVDIVSSAIATSMNDHIKPVIQTDYVYLEDGFDSYSGAIQENVCLVEAFLCDALGLPRKESIEVPIGFSRPPDPPGLYLDIN